MFLDRMASHDTRMMDRARLAIKAGWRARKGKARTKFPRT